MITIPNLFSTGLSATLSDQIKDIGCLAFIVLVIGIPLFFVIVKKILQLLHNWKDYEVDVSYGIGKKGKEHISTFREYAHTKKEASEKAKKEIAFPSIGLEIYGTKVRKLPKSYGFQN